MQTIAGYQGMRMAIHPIGNIFYGYVANKQGGYLRPGEGM
jgi:hypothetical protein